MIDEIKDDANARMAKTIVSLEGDLAKIRTGRAHPSLLDQVMVEYYGSDVPINQVANIIVEDARTLMVSPWEKPLKAVIEKAILTSNLGLNPSSSGDVIRIPLPPLTEERRKQLVKLVKQDGESTKVALRNIRRDAISDLKAAEKEKMISKDDEHKGEEIIQKITDGFVKQVDDRLKEKEKEVMTI